VKSTFSVSSIDSLLFPCAASRYVAVIILVACVMVVVEANQRQCRFIGLYGINAALVDFVTPVTANVLSHLNSLNRLKAIVTLH
jgi:hypothetical protein